MHRPGIPGGNAIWIASGHAIGITNVNKKLAALDALSVRRALSVAEEAWLAIREYEDSIGRRYLGGDEVFRGYKEAQEQKDWGEADRLFLDELARDRVKYYKFLDAEETLHAFNTWLCRAAIDSDHVYRWIDPPELASCTGGTFESRIELDGTRRGFKALSANPGLRFGGRKVRMQVPVNDAMRRGIQCVRYTVLPRLMPEKNERIRDPKSARHAAEAEVRVPDGTPIPIGTDFVVLPGTKIDKK